MSWLRVAVVLVLVIICVVKFGNADLKVTDQVYFDVEADGKSIGRITIGLFGEDVPKTVKNFKYLASRGLNGKSYKGTKFHRVIRRFVIQGGDVLNNNGTGTISIYGSKFKDENVRVKHNGAGVISMANTGPDTNGCQFFITTIALPYLDGKHVAFGRVIKGQEVVHIIEQMETDEYDRPVQDVIISNSGIVKNHKPFYENEIPYEVTVWAWLKAGWFPLSFSFAILGFFHLIMRRLDGIKHTEEECLRLVSKKTTKTEKTE